MHKGMERLRREYAVKVLRKTIRSGGKTPAENEEQKQVQTVERGTDAAGRKYAQTRRFMEARARQYQQKRLAKQAVSKAGRKSVFQAASSALRRKALAAGSALLIVVTIMACLFGAFSGSSYGILLSDGAPSDGSELSLQSVMDDLDAELEERIAEIIATVPHNSAVSTGEPAPWKDILAVYAVIVTTDPENPDEVVTMNEEKRAMLEKMFWDMNVVEWETETVGDSDSARVVLRITVSGKTTEAVGVEYGFGEEQLEMVEELCSLRYFQ